ncbi:MAG: glutamate mutase L [Anaerolineae bacterium]
MAKEFQLESVLTADLGSAITRVSLMDRIAGEYRLVAMAEAQSTPRDMSVGLREAVEDIEVRTGERLLGKEGNLITPESPDGTGVDGLVAITSAADPIQLILAATGPRSLGAARRAAATTYSTIADERTSDRLRLSSPEAMGSFLAAFASEEVDAVVLAGGTDGGARQPVLELASTLALFCASQVHQGRPHIIFAGNQDVSAQIDLILGGVSDLEAAANITPAPAEEDLSEIHEALERMFVEDKIRALPGIEKIRSWSLAPIQPTVKALAWTVEYLSRQYNLDVLGADLGAGSTSLVGSLSGRPALTISGGTGLAFGLDRLLETLADDDILRWLPFEMEGSEVRMRLLNKAARPGTLPGSREDALLEQAVGRELFSRVLATSGLSANGAAAPSLPPLDLIVGSGGLLSHTAHDRQAALLLLDALQPVGVCSIALDRLGIMSQIGALAAVEPLAAAQVLVRDGLVNLGTVVALQGTGRPGSMALRFKVIYPDESVIEGEATYGTLEVVPLPADQVATLELRPSGGFDVGMGRKGGGATTEVEGGTVGIIIDARGRPLSLPEDATSRRARIQEWMWEAGY